MRWRLAPWMLIGTVAAAWAAEPAQTQYYAVFCEGKKIGYGLSTRKVQDGKVTTTEMMELTMSRLGLPITARQEETCVETTGGKPLAFKSLQDAAILVTRIEGTVDERDKVHAAVTTGASTRTETLDWPAGSLLSEGLRLLQEKKGLKEGTTYTVKTFAPSLLRALDAAVVVGGTREVDLLGRVVRLTEVKTTVQGPTGELVSTSYVDKDLKALKTVVPVAGMNIETIACAREVAMSKPEVFEAFDRLVVASPVSLGRAASAKAITYKLAPTGEKKLSLPSTDSQTVQAGEDGMVVVTVRAASPPAGVKFPYTGKDEQLLAATRPARYLQSDDAKVARLAREAVGDATDAADAVKRIEAFVAKYVTKKDLSVGYATAAEVAESRQGDCSEHAVLVAAMCRAAGVPARVVMGVLYAENVGSQRQVFGGHAWAQACVGGKWVDLDAATGGFDPRRIALSVGDGSPEDFFGLIANLGYFRIAGVSVEK